MTGVGKSVALALVAALASCAARGGSGVPTSSGPAPVADPSADLRARADQALAAARPAEAAALFEEAAARWPAEDWPLLGLARARLAGGDPGAGVAAAGRALAVRESAEGRALRGRALARQRQWDPARADLVRALEAHPSDAASWAILVAVEVNRGDRVEATYAYRKVAALLPAADAANAAWKELRFLPPDPTQPEESLDRCTRGYTALLEGEPIEALREAENGMRFAPQFEWCGVVRAEALWRTNDAAGAEQILRWAIQRYPPEHQLLSADAKGVLAELLSTRRETAPRAAELARDALAARGDRATTLAALVRACEATGDGACVKDASRRLLAQPHIPDALRAQAEERSR